MVEVVEAFAFNNCACIWIRRSMRLALDEPFVPVPDDPVSPDEEAGVVVSTVLPSA